MLNASANRITNPHARARRGTGSDPSARSQSSVIPLPLDHRALRSRHHHDVDPSPAATEASIRRFAEVVAMTVVAEFRNQLTGLSLGDEPRLPVSVESLLDGRVVDDWTLGEVANVADDRVLATVLFTDIVNSTRTAAEMGDRDWHALLDAHDAVVRAQLARFRGREVNTSGDGFLAMFDGPQRAIRCAMAIRDAVQPLGIEVRAGLHTGECEVRGDDIGGIGVHIGARVSALAGPNDVLVSSTLRDLVIGSGLAFEDRGAHELKGVPGEWRLFAVAS
jgi:class 3 adenylate cyclase